MTARLLGDTAVTNMALSNAPFQNNKENSSKTGLLRELLCYLSRTRSMKSDLWGEKGSGILMILMKSISYQNNNAILFKQLNKRLDIHVKGTNAGSLKPVSGTKHTKGGL